MKLYLTAISKNGIGYIPDWLKVNYKENEQDLELTLDIQGDIDYSTDCLNCRCKGDLIPWVLYNQINGEEINLYDLSKEEIDKMFSIKKIIEILQTGANFKIGISLINEEDLELIEDDILLDCKGLCEFYDGKNNYGIHFKFETEIIKTDA